MGRLTELLTNECGGIYTEITNERECIDKLGQKEDDDEELGIDSHIIFKGTKEVWYRQTITHYEDGANFWCSGSTETIIHNSIISRIDFQHKSVYIKGAKQWFYIKDYGKTWALTREEL